MSKCSCDYCKGKCRKVSAAINLKVSKTVSFYETDCGLCGQWDNGKTICSECETEYDENGDQI